MWLLPNIVFVHSYWYCDLKNQSEDSRRNPSVLTCPAVSQSCKRIGLLSTVTTTGNIQGIRIKHKIKYQTIRAGNMHQLSTNAATVPPPDPPTPPPSPPPPPFMLPSCRCCKFILAFLITYTCNKWTNIPQHRPHFMPLFCIELLHVMNYKETYRYGIPPRIQFGYWDLHSWRYTLWSPFFCSSLFSYYTVYGPWQYVKFINHK